MNRLINGTVDFTTNGLTPVTTGVWSFTNAIYANVTDFEGLGTSVITTGFVIYIPAMDSILAVPIPGLVHRYRLTEVTVVDYQTISGQITWDETNNPNDEVDVPFATVCAISERGSNIGLGFTPSTNIYPQLIAGGNVSALDADARNYIDKISAGVGPQGVDGSQGIIGPQGLTGNIGAQGPLPINPVTKWSVPTVTGPQGLTSLSEATLGDIAVVQSDGSCWILTTGSPSVQSDWVDLEWTQIEGPQGPIGLTGATGTQGNTGVIGPQGFSGTNGIDGATGPQGLMGEDGSTGPQGNAGVNAEPTQSYYASLISGGGPQSKVHITASNVGITYTAPTGGNGLYVINIPMGVNLYDTVINALGTECTGPQGFQGPQGFEPANILQVKFNYLGDERNNSDADATYANVQVLEKEIIGDSGMVSPSTPLNYKNLSGSIYVQIVQLGGGTITYQIGQLQYSAFTIAFDF